jgi:RES domain-containing protein
VLDLTDSAVLADRGIGTADLGGAWKDLFTRGIVLPSWTLAQRLAGTGTAWIIVPSFASGAGAEDINVVLWHWAADPRIECG